MGQRVQLHIGLIKVIKKAAFGWEASEKDAASTAPTSPAAKGGKKGAHGGSAKATPAATPKGATPSKGAKVGRLYKLISVYPSMA
jgi:hypothetical protein